MAIKATIGYMPAVESINRKFALRREKVNNKVDAIKCYMGGMTRTTYHGGVGAISKNFMFFRKHAISVPATASQITVRERFSDTVECVNYILTDLTQMSSVKALYTGSVKEPTNTVEGFSAYGETYRGWVWKVCYHRLANGATVQAVKTFPTEYDA